MKKNIFNSSLFYPILGIVIFIVAWQIILGGFLYFFDLEQFRGLLPLYAFIAIGDLAIEPFFWYSIFISLTRIFIGIFFSFLLGFPIGLMLGLSKKMSRISQVPLQVLRMVSPLSWMPIAVLLLPSFEAAIYFLLIVSGIWPIIINVVQGISQIEKDWINIARNHGATGMQLITKIIIPGSIPSIMLGLRLCLGVSWFVLVPAEFLGVSSGLGYMINNARDTMNYDRLMAVVVVIGIIGFSMDFTFKKISNLLDWRNRQ